MPTDAEIKAKFWKALKSDMTLMLALTGVDEGHSRPMTAQLDDDHEGPIWFFTDTDTELVQAMGDRHVATAHFASKGHDLFAAIHGELVQDNDKATIDRLWNPFIAAWFDGKDDPKLRLLRLDGATAQIWLSENNFLAGIKMLFGKKPEQDYGDKIAEVRLN